MALIDPEAPEESMDFLDEASAYFLRAIKQHYTRDTAVDVMEALTPILGKDWKGRTIFGIMANKHAGIKSLSIYRNVNEPTVQKIVAIKEVRSLTRMGLAEAKTVVEDAYFKPMHLSLTQKPQDMSTQDWDRSINSSINVLRMAGFNVEFA